MKLFSFKIKYQRYEILLMRFMFAGLVYKTFNSVPTFPNQEFPVGVAQFFNLTFLANDTIQTILSIFFEITLCTYALGIGLILSTGYMLFYSVSLVTLFYSQGSIGHGYNIVSLVILAQFIAYIYGLFKFRKGINEPTALNRDDLAIYFTLQIIAAAYIIAGLTKLIRSGFVYGIFPAWITRLKFFSVQIIKTHDQSFYGSLDQSIYDKGNLIANFLVNHELFTQMFFSAGLFLELFAFMLLISRGFSFCFGVLLIMLHIGIMLVMNLHFWSNVYVLAIFTLHLPWLISTGINKGYLLFEVKREGQGL